MVEISIKRLNAIKGFNYDTFNFSSCTILSYLGRLTEYAKELFIVGTPIMEL